MAIRNKKNKKSKINHNKSTALERSVINYWGGWNQFYVYATLDLGSAGVYKHTIWKSRKNQETLKNLDTQKMVVHVTIRKF